ncbi:MAG: radical SAM family heme chaperone HemW [Cytophagia bacterium]|nr:MAG: radical SAM family heme chaperone HemW [Runella sp.]TAG19840.1 MAG: radical SAM family heme chaperone HemW [Cytophagales bacterium]TAG39079.1 MAG: radical SAM family heme chaperone HemW [Cytophagia bacterium]TAG50967.1 MAG: radical SAM family heme chaperone HemW [Runella slithyformis]TAG80726.1 MAG: radical SAM family heme chaperone HemW [Cytophagales bacterium]
MHLYLHIPFCKQACHYCDFYFSTNLKSKGELVAAICRELELQRHYLPTPQLETIYLGGGTPSILSEAEFGQIFETIHRVYEVKKQAEITIEANPDDLSQDKLRVLRAFGNRLSIGIQSFYEPYLKRMNRAHTAQESQMCVKRAQDAGFENLTIDLMYGVWQQTGQSTDANQIWQQDLEQAVALQVPHISSYNLTIEPQTAFGKWLKKGEILPIDEELSVQQFEKLIAELTTHGYEHYEISNFAKPGHYARHNSSYWKRRPYLGIGPSAHSFNGHSRQYNVANNAQYIKALQAGKLPFEREELSRFDQVNDYLLTSLRTMWGCDLRTIRAILGETPPLSFQKAMAEMQQKSWLKLEDDVLHLTPQGKLFADRAASNLFLV